MHTSKASCPDTIVQKLHQGSCLPPLPRCYVNQARPGPPLPQTAGCHWTADGMGAWPVRQLRPCPSGGVSEAPSLRLLLLLRAEERRSSDLRSLSSAHLLHILLLPHVPPVEEDRGYIL